MDKTYRSILPPAVQLLVDEIEAAAHTEIGIIVDPQVGSRMQIEITKVPASPVPADSRISLSVRVLSSDLAATTRDYNAPFAMFTHELLHLRRFYVDRVPSVCFIAGKPWSNRDPQSTVFSCQSLETLLEHIVIEPMVQQYVSGHQYRPHANWDSVPKTAAACTIFCGGSAFEAMWQCLALWIRTCFLDTDADNKKAAEGVMRQLGLLENARALTDLIEQLVKSPDPVRAKAAMVAAVCSALRLPLWSVGVSCAPDWKVQPLPPRIAPPAELCVQ